MRVTELLTKDTIAMDLMANDKNGVIDELVNQLDKAGKLSDVASFKEAIHNQNHKVQLVSAKVLPFHMPKWPQYHHQLLRLVNLKQA